jgi:hypothetical protein
MSKLITAKEAVALSNVSERIDYNITRINDAIKAACERYDNRAIILLDSCPKKEAIVIAAHLRAAGYCFKWEEGLGGRGTWFTISWGGS